jgi:hypothetical protein
MIAHILDLLSETQADTEEVRIAKGKYSYPESIKEVIQKRDLYGS